MRRSYRRRVGSRVPPVSRRAPNCRFPDFRAQCERSAGRLGTDSCPLLAALLPGTVMTVVCLASYFKGNEFLRQLRRRGCRVVLVIKEKLRDEEWARDSIDETLTVANGVERRRLRRGRLGVRPPQPRRPHRRPRGVRRDARGDDPRASAHSRAWARRRRACSATSSRCASRRSRPASVCPTSSTC